MYYLLYTVFHCHKNKLIDKTEPGELIHGCSRAGTYMRECLKNKN